MDLIGNLCYYCEERLATHLEILEMDYQLYMCPEHYEAWRILQPVKSQENTAHDCNCRHWEETEMEDGEFDSKEVLKKSLGCPPDMGYCHPINCQMCHNEYRKRKRRLDKEASIE